MNIFSKYDVDNSATLDLLVRVSTGDCSLMFIASSLTSTSQRVWPYDVRQEFFLCVDDLRQSFPDVDYATAEEELSIVFLKISSIEVSIRSLLLPEAHVLNICCGRGGFVTGGPRRKYACP